MRFSRGSWLLMFAVLLTACATGRVRRFPLEEPMWSDPDRRPFSPPPEEYYSPFGWDAADQTLFRPLSRFLAFEPDNEAVNVNAMDEVPNSSWFTNRMGKRELSVERTVQAACAGKDPLDPSGPWTVSSAKPNGANPGFIIDGPDDHKYLLKFDGDIQPERATAADVIGSIAYWAAGYYAPCNRIVYFDRSILEIGEGATAEEGGDKVPLTWKHVDKVLAMGTRRGDGKLRAVASRFLPGKPLGPWRYQGTREDDPNDVVPHQDRRDLRGAYVLASWINHFDSREQNTLAMWIESEGGGGHVRHNFLDFGDSFGSLWDWDEISRRLGHSYYLDIPYMMQDLVTLGLITQPWETAEYGPTGKVLGYYGVRRFKPDEWRPGYPNPAFSNMTERDAAWMARILAHFRPEHVRAMVQQARIQDPGVRRELLRILLGRRERILQRWFRRLSPLTHPQIRNTESGAELCLRDLAVYANLIDWEARPYTTRGWMHIERFERLDPIAVGPLVRRRPHRICAELPSIPDSTPGSPAYLIVDVTGMYGPADSKSKPARVHMYQIGPDDYRIVGLERPYADEPPGT